MTETKQLMDDLAFIAELLSWRAQWGNEMTDQHNANTERLKAIAERWARKEP